MAYTMHISDAYNFIIMIQQFGETALFKASYRGWIEVVITLLEAGANVNTQDIVSI